MSAVRAALVAVQVPCVPFRSVGDEPNEFPPELTRFEPAPQNPVFTAEGPGHWDVKMRERGWILREGDAWHLFYSGYDGTRAGIKRLGHAPSPDGLHWTRDTRIPLYGEHWV